MELNINQVDVSDDFPAHTTVVSETSKPKSFIEANTQDMSMTEMKNDHIIPVWTQTNEPLISHSEFIETVYEIVCKVLPRESILSPQVRVSHPVKGRIPEAKHKPAAQLEPWEQTLYFERMMFVIEVPSILEIVNGNALALTIGGVKSYAHDNMFGKRANGLQHFQMFIGFQNRVCTNLCVWTDGLKLESTIRSIVQLQNAAENMITGFKPQEQLNAMRAFGNINLSETEFAQVMGRARMYRHIPEGNREHIPLMLLGDNQLGAVVRDYYRDDNFCVNGQGNITLWNFYNLLTGASKTSYIDSFLERLSSALDFSNEIMNHKVFNKRFWYMG